MALNQLSPYLEVDVLWDASEVLHAEMVRVSPYCNMITRAQDELLMTDLSREDKNALIHGLSLSHKSNAGDSNQKWSVAGIAGLDLSKEVHVEGELCIRIEEGASLQEVAEDITLWLENLYERRAVTSRKLAKSTVSKTLLTKD